MPSVIHVVSNHNDNEWYPVEWDVSNFVGETAILEIADHDKAGSIGVDSFKNTNTDSGCLPTCLSIDRDTCDGAPCYSFEGDKAKYLQVKRTGATSGVYCYDAPEGARGTKIGDRRSGLGAMGRLKQGILGGDKMAKVMDKLAAIEAAPYTIGDCVEVPYGDGSGGVNKACVTTATDNRIELKVQDGMDGSKLDGKFE